MAYKEAYSDTDDLQCVDLNWSNQLEMVNRNNLDMKIHVKTIYYLHFFLISSSKSHLKLTIWL